MADLKISQLTDGTPAQASDQIPVNRAGTNVRVDASSVGALAVGGSDTFVQYNNSGAFGGDAGLTFNATTKSLTVGGSNTFVNAPSLNVTQTWTPTIFVGSTSGTTLTVTGVTQGSITIGMSLTASGIVANQRVVAFGTGTGGEGTYTVSVSQNLSSRTFTGFPVIYGSQISITDSLTGGSNFALPFAVFGGATATSELFSVTRDGSVRLPSGIGYTSSSFNIGPTSDNTAANIVVSIASKGGSGYVAISGILHAGSGLKLYGSSPVGWASAFNQNNDINLFREGAGILGMRNGTTPQAFRVYNTESSSLANYERGKFAWESNVLRIGTEKAGTGLARAMELHTDGTLALAITTAQKAEFAATIKTGAPSGGTAAEWKLGTVATVSPTSPNRTIEVEIGGTTYYLAAKTTND